MKKCSILFFYILLLSFLSCKTSPQEFSKEALSSVSYDLQGNEVSLESILNKNKGKKIFIDVWASWCSDCVGSIPKVKELYTLIDTNKVAFVYLSVDKEQGKWKKAIEKYDLKGQHYYQKQGWDSKFNKSIELDWIPRYMVVDEFGKIEIFKSIEADDNTLLKALN